MIMTSTPITDRSAIRGLCAAVLLCLSIAVSPGAKALDTGAVSLDFEAKAGTLSGSLFLPPGEGPFPAVIFLAGSGDNSYREGWEGENRPFFWPQLQQWFSARGYAVYLFDKPGVGRSAGDWRHESFADRADNSLAAARAVAAHPDIDGQRTGLLGHSQGGWIAVSAAAADAESVAFVISLAGPATDVRQQIVEDTVNRWRCDDKGFLALRQAGLGGMLSGLGAIGRVLPAGYLSRIVHYDPADDLARMEQPMLALFATNDIMVMPETNIPRLEHHFGRESGNTQLVVASINGLDHFFRYGAFCLDAPRPANFAPEFWQALDSSEFWRHVHGGSD